MVDRDCAPHRRVRGVERLVTADHVFGHAKSFDDATRGFNDRATNDRPTNHRAANHRATNEYAIGDKRTCHDSSDNVAGRAQLGDHWGNPATNHRCAFR
jgi:hypothetical protein